jgi:glycosyltransferase involved in cell wall biosynthesis
MNRKCIYINRKPIAGPWGGGNKFVKNLASKLKSLKFKVTYELSPDVDIIFCFDPRPNSAGLWYQDFLNHKAKYKSIIMQRVGDVGTHSKPELTNLVKQCIQYSDYLIFPSQWAKNYISCDKSNAIVVDNKPQGLFYNFRSQNKTIDRVKIVTHHWSNNPKKGFDIYEKLGKLINEKSIDVDFTYIGRWNDNYSNEGIKIIAPKDSNSLSRILPQHNVYLTASLEEAGANHVLEAMASGLPILYRTGGGSIDEYCNQYGISYNEDFKTLLSGIDLIRQNYNSFKDNVLNYKNTIDDSTDEYVRIICQI